MAKSQRKSKAFIRKCFEREKILSKHAPEGPNDFVLILDRLKSGFNVPKIFRTAQAFGCRKIFLIDVGPFDPSPARGGFRQTHSEFLDPPALHKFEELRQEGYELFILDPHAEGNLFEMKLPKKSAFILGHEEYGVSPETLAMSGARRMKIPHWGQTESLNVSIAASLVMYEYLRQHKALIPEDFGVKRDL